MPTKTPIILAIDDDPEVLQAISRDLRSEYGGQYRVIRADSGAQALEISRAARLTNEVIALFLADQRMPGMSGVEFLQQAKDLFPEAKRALLTAYADTDAAIKAINDVHVDYYLMKPWDPPEHHLYPVLSDLLGDWSAGYRPTFSGIRLVGHRWSPDSHAMRDFLARNQVPFEWADISSDPEAEQILALSGHTAADLPVVILPNGVAVPKPTVQDLAERIGLRHASQSPLYDLIILGGGPAGLAAAVYGASEGLKTCIVERHAAGGQAGTSSRIENYLGFPSGLSGEDLARRAATQAQRFGAESLLTHEAVRLTATPGSVGVELQDGTELRGESLVIATGVSYRLLDAPGISELTGSGVYYGPAGVPAQDLKGQDVYVVGGANSAGQAAVYFSGIANSVTMIVRGESLSSSMSHYLIERIEHTPNISVRYHSAVTAASGTNHLETIDICNWATNKQESVPAGALFIFIGAVPPTTWLAPDLQLDDRGFILTGPDILAAGKDKWPLERNPLMLETSIPGVFAAGDVRHGSGKRVATAVGEGASAVMSVWQYRSLMGL
jgi:thioredoxin reductase (NADPH)